MVGLVMIGAGSMMAVVCVRSCVMVDLVVSGRICDGGDGVPFSTQGVGRLLLSAPFLSKCWFVGFRKVTSILT